jgi:hypothetical protein
MEGSNMVESQSVDTNKPCCIRVRALAYELHTFLAMKMQIVSQL